MVKLMIRYNKPPFSHRSLRSRPSLSATEVVCQFNQLKLIDTKIKLFLCWWRNRLFCNIEKAEKEAKKNDSLTNFGKMKGVHAGMLVAKYAGNIHNIENIGCGPEC